MPVQKEGTGLGLSISKEFIEAQGGQIKVECNFWSRQYFHYYIKCCYNLKLQSLNKKNY